MFAEIVTDRLALRDLQMSDAKRIFEYRSHPAVAKFQSWGRQSADAVQSYIRTLSASTTDALGLWYQVGIILLSTRELIGDCAFRRCEHLPRNAEVGIALAPEFQGHGYATEALRALFDYLFHSGNDRVYGSVDPRNCRSIQLLQRVGMQKEAYRIRHVCFKGEWTDEVTFSIRIPDICSGE